VWHSLTTNDTHPQNLTLVGDAPLVQKRHLINAKDLLGHGAANELDSVDTVFPLHDVEVCRSLLSCAIGVRRSVGTKYVQMHFPESSAKGPIVTLASTQFVQKKMNSNIN